MTPTEHILKWRLKVTQAALSFESRWTWLALRNLDPGVAQDIFEQRGLFEEACVAGTPNDVAVHGQSMLKGYAIASRAMEVAQVPDDAYVIGVCPTTGYKVAIGFNKASVPRVLEIHGQDVVWFSPDEVATLAASSEAFLTVSALKKKFPGAEVIERYAGEGS